MISFRTIGLGSLLLGLTALAGAAPAQSGGGKGVSIRDAKMAGSGCKAGPLDASLRESQNAQGSPTGEIVVKIPPFEAAIDGKRRLARKNCNMILAINHSRGQLRLDSVDLSVAKELKGVKGDLTLSAHFQGGADTATKKVAAFDGKKSVDLGMKMGPCGSSTTIVANVGALVRGKGAGRIQVKEIGPLKISLSPCESD